MYYAGFVVILVKKNMIEIGKHYSLIHHVQVLLKLSKYPSSECPSSGCPLSVVVRINMDNFPNESILYFGCSHRILIYVPFVLYLLLLSS